MIPGVSPEMPAVNRLAAEIVSAGVERNIPRVWSVPYLKNTSTLVWLPREMRLPLKVADVAVRFVTPVVMTFGLGISVGVPVGVSVSVFVGVTVGVFVGIAVGVTVGVSVGIAVGGHVGPVGRHGEEPVGGHVKGHVGITVGRHGEESVAEHVTIRVGITGTFGVCVTIFAAFTTHADNVTASAITKIIWKNLWKFPIPIIDVLTIHVHINHSM